MRVLSVLTHGHLPQLMGGIQTVVHDLNHMLKARGHPTAVLSALLPGDSIHLWNRVKSKLPPRSPCPADRVLGYPTYRGWGIKTCAQQAVRNFKPDIVIVHGPPPIDAARIFCDLGIPTLVYFHGFDLEGAAPIESSLVTYIANSRFTASKIYDDYGISCPVIPPLTRLSMYRCVRLPRTVTMVNPVPAKGVDTAIAIATARPDIQFLFVKAWQSLVTAENAAVARLVETLPNVTLSEAVSDMRRIFRQTKILLMPSRCQETWGRTAGEAQISGIPVIARRVGGLPESVGDGGVLLSPEAPDSDWVDTVSALWDSTPVYEDASRRAGANAARLETDFAEAFEHLVGLCEGHIAAHR